MSDDKKVGRTLLDVFFSLSRKARIGLMILIPVIILTIFLLTYWFAEPGETVSLFGLIKIKKSSQASKPTNLTETDQTEDSSVKKDKIKAKLKPGTKVAGEEPDPTAEEERLKPVSLQTTYRPTTSPPHSKKKTHSLIKAPVKRHGISVLIVQKNQIVDWDLTHKIAFMVEKGGGEITPNPALTERFVSSGKFERVFKGNPKEIVGLGAKNPASHLILGKQVVVFSQNSNFEGLITANASVKIQIVSSKQGNIEDSFTITGKGVGYTKEDAERNALENISKNLQIRLLQAIQLKKM